MSPWYYLWVSGAGSAGAVARFVVDGALRDRLSADSEFPLGTMLINISGSLLLGILAGIVSFGGRPELWKIVGGTGFCGGYTTFSTASFETVRLLAGRSYRLAALSGGATLVLSIAAAAAGMALSRL